MFIASGKMEKSAPVSIRYGTLEVLSLMYNRWAALSTAEITLIPAGNRRFLKTDNLGRDIFELCHRI